MIHGILRPNGWTLPCTFGLNDYKTVIQFARYANKIQLEALWVNPEGFRQLAATS